MLNVLRHCAWLLTIVAVAADTGAAETDRKFIYQERPNMPPAVYVPRDDYHSRSEALSVTVGPYTSVQANVDALGLNIVGDAANEPSIAVDPTDPDNIVIGWRQFDSIASDFRQAGYAFTTDGGQSWTFPGSLTPGTFRSDPVLDFDSQGSAFYHSLKSNFDVDLFKSGDAGMSWGTPVPAFGGDKNWMVVDRSGGIGDGNIYGVWRPDFGCCGNNMFSRSANGGASFESPVPIAGSPGIGTMAVGPDGAVYIAGLDESSPGLDTVLVARSINAQNPGSTPTATVSEVPLGGAFAFFFPPNPSGLLGQMNVAVDHSGGTGHGFVYVLASLDPDAPNTNPIDVLFSRSEDGGESWSPALRVNDDPANGGTWHWLGALAVAPNGRLDAVWNDTRNSGSPFVSELFYSYSWDHGATWSANIPVSPPFDSTVGWPQQQKIGDYYTVVSDATSAHVAYSATFNGEQDVYYVELFPDCNDNGQSDVTDVGGSSTDCNANLVPDECETGLSCSAGSTPDGAAVPGQPLRLAKAAGGNVHLSWGASCKGGDSDFGVYEGSIGDFTSHGDRVCSTAGATELELLPTSAASYFLVVPHNAVREGSYGRADGAAERAQGRSACFPQEIGGCQIFPGH